jgi:hypothetical protein
MGHVSGESVIPGRFPFASFVFSSRTTQQQDPSAAGRLSNGSRRLLRWLDDTAAGGSFVHRQQAVACSYKSTAIHLGGAELALSSSASAHPNKQGSCIDFISVSSVVDFIDLLSSASFVV